MKRLTLTLAAMAAAGAAGFWISQLPALDVTPSSRPVRPATARVPSHRNARATGEKPRPFYPFSVIPGGVYARDEVRGHVTTDPVVAGHYAFLRLSELKPVRLERDRQAYVSYRKGNRIYWTARPVTLRAGEVLLSDGSQQIRARCGNRISTTPQGPVETAGTAPTEQQMDQAVVPAAEAAPLQESVPAAPAVPTPAANSEVAAEAVIAAVASTPAPGPAETSVWAGPAPFAVPISLAAFTPGQPTPNPQPITPGNSETPVTPPGETPTPVPPVIVPVPPVTPNPPSVTPPPVNPPPVTPPVIPPSVTPPDTPVPPPNPPQPPVPPHGTPPGDIPPSPPIIVPPTGCLVDCGHDIPPPSEVPEPQTWILIALGMGAAAVRARKR